MTRRNRRGLLAAIGLGLVVVGSLMATRLVSASTDPAADPAALFGRANEAFRDGRYDQAVDGYRALVAAGYDGADVHFNLGNAHLGRGELGAAVASFLRARRSAPRDAGIRANLELARAEARDDVQPPDPGRAVSTLFFWHYRWSPREAAWALAAANLLLWSLLALGLALRIRSDGWRAAVALTAAALVALGVSVAVRRLAPREVAVVTAGEVEAFSGLGEAAVSRFVLHEGTEVRIRERRPEGLRVALPSGVEGWLPLQGVEIVRP